MSHDCSCHGTDDRLATTVIGQIERPLYAPGLILEDSDLTAAVDYTRELNRLLFRTLFGCGVICGLRVGIRENCGLLVTIAPGLALDGCGDPLHLTGPATVKLDERDGVLSPAETSDAPRRTEFWILACGTERRCAPRSLVCDDSLDDMRQATRARGATEISITFDSPDCACGFSPEGLPNDRGERDALAKRLLPRAEAEAQAEAVSTRDETKNPDTKNPDTKDPGQPKPVDTQTRAPEITDECPPDCGCGSACECGCCVLLGWARWTEGRGWVVLHKGVRRFVRPQLIDDPIDDQGATKS